MIQSQNILNNWICLMCVVGYAVASKHILKDKKPFDDHSIDHGEVVRGERSEERINLSVPGAGNHFLFTHKS